MKKGGVQLVGHSGCRLEIETIGGEFVVTKTSKNKAYNPRLELQAAKQRDFTHDTFAAPKVLAAGYTKDGLYQFSMEYINGFTLAEHLRHVSAAELSTIVDYFVRFIPQDAKPDKNARDAHLAKLKDVANNIKVKDAATAEALHQLSVYPWEYTLQSYCHGDLTLENIIWRNGDLYLIDFLDSYHDSWMQDFGKLIFDLESLWSYRGNSVDENLRTRVSIFKDLLLERLESQKNGRATVREVYHLAILHALRILPYTGDKATLAHIQSGIIKLQDSVDSL